MEHAAHGSVASGSVVLVGVDDSANSERAFELALDIGRSQGWPLRVVTAFSFPYVPDAHHARLSESYGVSATQGAQALVDGFAARAAAAGVDVATRVIEGSAGGVLVDESRYARLAVVGKRGRNRFAGQQLGSVSAQLAAHSHCPTLVVPAVPDAGETSRGDEQKPSREPGDNFECGERGDDELDFSGEIVVGIDVGHPAASTVALTAAETAELCERPLTLVAAAPLDAWFPLPARHRAELGRLREQYSDYLEHIADVIADEYASLPVRRQFVDGSPADILAEASRTAALVVVGTRGRGGFAGLLLGSVSRALLGDTVAPVLVVPVRSVP
ncbi:universal stress protein [Brevibacterium daeguense]|uniref:Universal stress protein n=1 Tax=Brevibacterium daeguense TaxID=909936 RepID=A0ABP8EG88_9MICO|nr:universal stress protein [Brevibacterium daeguense]